MKRVLPSMIFMVVAFSALLAQDSEQLRQMHGQGQHSIGDEFLRKRGSDACRV